LKLKNSTAKFILWKGVPVLLAILFNAKGLQITFYGHKLYFKHSSKYPFLCFLRESKKIPDISILAVI